MKYFKSKGWALLYSCCPVGCSASWVYLINFSCTGCSPHTFFFFSPSCYGLNCVLLKFICWSPNPSYLRMSPFGDNVFKEVIKVKWGHICRPRSNLTGVLIRRGRGLGMHTLRRKAMWGHSEQWPSANLGRNQTCQNLDLGCLASRTGRK